METVNTTTYTHNGRGVQYQANSNSTVTNIRIGYSYNVSFHYLHSALEVCCYRCRYRCCYCCGERTRVSLPSTWNNIIFSDFILSMLHTRIFDRVFGPLQTIHNTLLTVYCAHNRKHRSKTCKEFLRQFIFTTHGKKQYKA